MLKDTGCLFKAAITPYATLLWATTVFGTKNRLLEDEPFMKMVAHELLSGEHIKPDKGAYQGMGTSHFHSADELNSELMSCGFSETRIHGVVGAAWLAPNIDELWKDTSSRDALMKTVRMLDEREDIIGLSTHLLAMSKKIK